MFDSLLTFLPHMYHLLRNLAGIRKYLSTDDMKSLVNAIVIAKVDNCSSLLSGISSNDLHKLQKFQNSCARLIYRKRKYDHVSGILKELHWLPSEARIHHKVLCYVFKGIHGLAPKYLSDLINIRRNHVSGILKDLHWLPSEARIYYKVLCYVFKRMHGFAPKYLHLQVMIVFLTNLIRCFW